MGQRGNVLSGELTLWARGGRVRAQNLNTMSGTVRLLSR